MTSLSCWQGKPARGICHRADDRIITAADALPGELRLAIEALNAAR
jgi:hypothetical protein